MAASRVVLFMLFSSAVSAECGADPLESPSAHERLTVAAAI
jgi:hypothetical protein